MNKKNVVMFVLGLLILGGAILVINILIKASETQPVPVNLERPVELKKEKESAVKIEEKVSDAEPVKEAPLPQGAPLAY